MRRKFITTLFVILIVTDSIQLYPQSLTWLGSSADAYDVSEDGHVVVGTISVSNGIYHAFRWTSSGGMQDIGTLHPEDTGSIATSVSANGNVVVGQSYNQFNSQAFIWKNGNMQALTPDSIYSIAYDVSADGNVVVGFNRYMETI